MAERVVVIGADAAGMSAASQALRVASRHGRELDVVAVDRGHWTSYSACGIPYWVAGDVDGPGGLIARTVEEHRERGIGVRLATEAESLDLDAGAVDVVDVENGRRESLGFDHLIIATGAVPVRPPLPGIDAHGVFGVQTLDDGAAVLEYLDQHEPANAVVVGAGYIGLEMAEAMVRRGLKVTVVERAPQPMTTLDPDMGRHVRAAMENMGIDVVTEVDVHGFDSDDDGVVRSVATDSGGFDAKIVVLGTGVRPATEVVQDAGLPLGRSGGLRVDDRQRVVGYDHVWAAGDCVETFDRVLGRDVYVPLGTHANKQGRVLGTNLGGGRAAFPGVVGTAVSKICDLEIARTGVREAEAQEAGLDYVSATIESTTRSGYFPGAQPLTVKVIAERPSADCSARRSSARKVPPNASMSWPWHCGTRWAPPRSP